MKPITAVGIMSGTSADGVDAISLRLTSVREQHEPEVLDHAFVPFEASLSAELSDPSSMTLARLSELHAELPRRYAEAVERLQGWKSADVVGMHGQTVWHGPPSNATAGHRTPNTLQIGSSMVLAEALGKPVVGDLRASDMYHGGEGAPIVPFAHWFFTPTRHAGRLIVNIGGIANVTHVAAALEQVRGHDVGPGMMIADHLARRFSAGQLDCDRDGSLSAGGRVLDEVLADVFGHAFFAKPPPRSTGREDFGSEFAEQLFERFGRLDSRDLLTSVLAVTARTIVEAAQSFAAVDVLLTGGGARNPTLVRLVRESLAVPVEVAQAGVFAASHHEPAAVALIAARTLARLPSSLPGVTGARRAAVLGHIAYPTPLG